MADPLDTVRDVMVKPDDIDMSGVPAAAQPSKVAHFRQDPAKLKPQALALLAAAQWAGDIAPVLQRRYVVKGWLDQSSVSVIYGPSNVGKSFLALDLAHHVAKGRTWGGRRVSKGRVLYVAAEGGGSFANRVAALDDPEFFVMTPPITLTGKGSQAAPLAEMIQHLAATGGAPFDLIVFDTMARVMGGLDENTAPDIADLMRNLDLIRRASGAHVMLVHHSGKDVAKGARGHSSLRAAIDTEIELTRDELGQITAELTKQRDGPTGYRFAYTLRQVELGSDQDGDPVTTCLVEPTDTARAGRVVVSDSALKALEVLDKVLAASGEVIRRPEYPGSPCVALETWRDACVEAGFLSTSDKGPSHRQAFHRVKDGLSDMRRVLIHDDLVWVVS